MANTKITTNVIADGAITSAKLDTNITISGDITGTLATAAQPNITSVGTLTALTGGTGDLNWDSGTLFVDSSANAVGIGTTSPSTALEVNNASAGATVATFEGTYNASGDVKLASFERNGGAVAAAVTYADASTAMEFGTTTSHALILTTGDTERMRIDSSGRLIVGNSSPFTADSVTIDQGGFLAIRNTSGSGMEVRRDGTDGNLIDFQKDGSTVGSIGAVSGDLAIYSTGSTHAGLRFLVEGIFPTNNAGTINDDTVELGGASNRFKNLYLSGQALVQSGGTTAPSFAFTNDPDTGMSRPTSDAINFCTAGSERVRIDSSGNVGIGATSANSSRLRLDNGGTSGAPQLMLTATGASTQTEIRHDTSNNLIFENWNSGRTERMRIDSSGNVGIGGSPTARLDVRGDGTWIRHSGYGQLLDMGNWTDGLVRIESTGAPMYLRAAGSNYMAFDTNSVERMRIDSSGNLAINGTNDSLNGLTNGRGHIFRANGESFHSMNDAGGANTLHVYDFADSTYRFYVGAAGSVAGNIYATNTSITGLSDERLKENIVDLETGLTEVMALQPRRFDWKNGDAQNVAGFIAQEVESVLPELVGDYKHEELEDCKSLKMGDIVPTLVKAIQEQQTIIDDLKTRIETLEG